MSVGFVVPERAPLGVTERWLVSALLRNLLFDVAWKSEVWLDVVFPSTPP